MQQDCEVWEFSSASDHDEVEAEEAALRQHILSLVILLRLCLDIGSVCVSPHRAKHLPIKLHTTSSSQGGVSTG